MESIVKSYGGFLLAALTLSLLLLILFGTGSVGGTAVAADALEKVMTFWAESEQRAEYDVFLEQAEISPPVVLYRYGGAPQSGMVLKPEWIAAYDANGRELSVELRGLTFPDGSRTALTQDGISLTQPGIYTLTVAAHDADNRVTVCKIDIPVNQ